LTGLDPMGIRRMRETILARAQDGAAILLSSHLLHLVEEVCSRVIIMNEGRKVADGAVADLAARAELAEAGSNLEQIFLHVTGRRSTGTAD
jgi:ABC-2 type transport system ATP-binding protein